jgi:hypothetical protein
MLPLALLILLAGSACLACPPALPGVDQSPTAPGDYGKCSGERGQRQLWRGLLPPGDCVGRRPPPPAAQQVGGSRPLPS